MNLIDGLLMQDCDAHKAMNRQGVALWVDFTPERWTRFTPEHQSRAVQLLIESKSCFRVSMTRQGLIALVRMPFDEPIRTTYEQVLVPLHRRISELEAGE